ncbi:MAG TPA: hypothetical protein PLC65_10900, partial [Bacteroidia bacterium]|nr:hypothetical protein [Bacteroidia bacterium]
MKSYIKYSFIILLFFFEKVLAQSWSPVGLGTNGPVFAFSVYNNELYVGGAFSMAGGIPANRIAKWDGSTWSSLGAGLDGNVFSLSVYNGELYAGGVFTTAGGNSAISVAKWNGSIWSAVGANSMNAPVYALIVYNGELYVGGQFYSGGSIYGGCLAKWDGSTWSNISTGMSGIGPGPDVAVHSLAVYNSELYASGSFTLTSGGPANYIAKWNGVSWSALGNNGLNAPAAALNVYNSELYAGGSFSNAGGSPAS